MTCNWLNNSISITPSLLSLINSSFSLLVFFLSPTFKSITLLDSDTLPLSLFSIFSLYSLAFLESSQLFAHVFLYTDFLRLRWICLDLLNLALWVFLLLFNYRHRYISSIPLYKSIQVKSTRLSTVCWIFLFLQFYHGIVYTTNECDPLSLPVFWVYFTLKFICLCLFSVGLAFQSQELIQVDYENAPELLFKPPTSFREFFTHFLKLIPFIWPKKNVVLQLFMFFSFICMILGRWVNVLLPIQYKKVIDALGSLDTNQLPWFDVTLFVLLRFLAGSSGILSSIESWLWIPVGQYTTREISVEMLRHLHHLSLRFHLNSNSFLNIQAF